MHSPVYLYPPAEPVRRRQLGLTAQCACTCPGGHGCCLNAGVPHTLHICGAPDCPCHSAQRYTNIGRPNVRALRQHGNAEASHVG